MLRVDHLQTAVFLTYGQFDWAKWTFSETLQVGNVNKQACLASTCAAKRLSYLGRINYLLNLDFPRFRGIDRVLQTLRRAGKSKTVEASSRLRYKLAVLLAEMADGLPRIAGWDEKPPVGSEAGCCPTFPTAGFRADSTLCIASQRRARDGYRPECTHCRGSLLSARQTAMLGAIVCCGYETVCGLLIAGRTTGESCLCRCRIS
jgi:hypothetical protein